MAAKKIVLDSSIPDKTINSPKVLDDVLESMRDIDCAASPGNSIQGFGNIAMLSPEDSITQSLINLLKLPVGKNVLFPDKGESISHLIFTSAAPEDIVLSTVKSYIEAHESRITVESIDIDVYVDEYSQKHATIDLDFKFKTGDEIYNTVLEFVDNV
mgnify:FL=1